MLTINFTFSCDQRTFPIEVKSTEIIREAYLKFLRTKPEYYKKILFKAMTLEGERLDPDEAFIDADIKNEDVIHILCDFKRTNSEVGKEEKVEKNTLDNNNTLNHLKC